MVADGIDPSDVRKRVRLCAAATIKQRALLKFSMDENGSMIIENKNGKMLFKAEQVLALRAFLDATREPLPCL